MSLYIDQDEFRKHVRNEKYAETQLILDIIMPDNFIAPHFQGTMVFFTVFATIDSLTLLVAMTGLLLSSAFSLKSLADLEHAAWKSLKAK